MVINPEFQKLANDKEGTRYVDRQEGEVRAIVLRGPMSLCAYLGIPETHPLAGFAYDDVNIACHYGLTYSASGDGKYLPKGYYWFGWDYGHGGDSCFYDLKYSTGSDGKQWTVAYVEAELSDAIESLRGAMAGAEAQKQLGV